MAYSVPLSFASLCIALAVLGLAACAPASPGVRGSPATAPAPGVRWTPPERPEGPPPAAPAALPPDVLARARSLTLADVVDLALRSSPATRAAWATARAAAASYGAARGSWLPQATLGINAIDIKTGGTQGRAAVQQTLYGPTVSFTWLLFDFGGRSGSVGAAREALLEANWTHNAAIEDAVLQVGQAYYTYAATRSLLGAQRTSLAEADSNLAAAEERRRVGVATIADVLQARTAVEQARLALQQTEGDLAAARGALAVSTGYPATLDFEVDSLADASPIGALADSVDALIASARASRPDLAAAEALVNQARANAQVARASRLPALSVTGNVGRTYISSVTGPRDSYNVQLGLSIPLFNGFAWEFDARAAEARADAQAARAEQLGQQAVLQVFTDYHALRTATERVRTAEALLASATESAAAAQARYRAGVGSLLELLTAENTLASARAQRIQARFGWRTSLLQLAHDAGLLDSTGGSRLTITPDSTLNRPVR